MAPVEGQEVVQEVQEEGMATVVGPVCTSAAVLPEITSAHHTA